MGVLVSSAFSLGGIQEFLCHDVFLCSVQMPVSSPRPAIERRDRAQALSRLAALQRPTAGLGLDGGEHGHIVLSLAGRKSSTTGGELTIGRNHRAATLYSVDRVGPDHDAAMRIGSEAPGQRVQSVLRRIVHGTGRTRHCLGSSSEIGDA
jgi:hypothetical protein